jgi:hypothetical protein
MMELFTQQSTDFDIVNDKTDLGKSVLYTEDICTKGYDYIFDILGKNSFIWCKRRVDLIYDKRNKQQTFDQFRIWCLEVNERNIICIDRDIWDHILLDSPYMTDEQYSSIMDLGGEELFDHVWITTDKHQSWKGLIKTNKSDWTHHDDYLIPSPIKKNWVQRTFLCTPEK